MYVCVLSICFWYELFIWLQVKNELPSTFKAYRYQQHRWSCGPANLFRKMAMEIINNKVYKFIYFFPWIIRNICRSRTKFVDYFCSKFICMLCPLQKVSLWKKIHVIYSFFFVRKVVAHINTFVFYCIVLPATVLVPEVVVPKWGAVYIPSIITILNAVGTPRSWFQITWTNFKNKFPV